MLSDLEMILVSLASLWPSPLFFSLIGSFLEPVWAKGFSVSGLVPWRVLTRFFEMSFLHKGESPELFWGHCFSAEAGLFTFSMRFGLDWARLALINLFLHSSFLEVVWADSVLVSILSGCPVLNRFFWINSVWRECIWFWKSF